MKLVRFLVLYIFPIFYVEPALLYKRLQKTLLYKSGKLNLVLKNIDNDIRH